MAANLCQNRAVRLDPRLTVGSRVGEYQIIAVVPHAFRPETWVVVGQDDDGYAVWTTSESGQIAEIYFYFNDVTDALADMLRRARSLSH